MGNGSPSRVRVGPFELDREAGELRDPDGQIRRLQEQPFQILLMLVDRSGALVTRDEIQRKLWPNDTVVEFDHSIHTAIKKLRQAFGDSGEDPKYIETVARRGYRLMVPVERVHAAEAGPPEVPTPLASSPSSSDRSEHQVSHYRVLEVLGTGGMGVVYKAEDIKLGRHVALKFLPDEIAKDAKALGRFEREARAASALDHPNICTIYEFGEHEGHPFIAMSLLEGQTLRDRITDRGRPFSLLELLHLSIQIADGLSAAHEKGIIHRDIKPANIFITNRDEAKILDFGLAKLTGSPEPERTVSPTDDAAAADHNLSLTGMAMGTVPYMSPEQVRGEKLDARTDLFSLGLVIYEMATGKSAFRDATAAQLREAILNQVPVPARKLNPAIPLRLEEIINKTLEKDREVRCQSAAELRADLKRLKRDSDSHPSIASSAVAVSPKPLRFNRKMLIGLALLAAVFAAWLLWPPAPMPHVLRSVPITNFGRAEPFGSVLSDGSRVYFAGKSGGTSFLAEVPEAGGDPSPIQTSLGSIQLHDIDRPRGRLLVSVESAKEFEEKPLWIVATAGGSGRRVGDVIASHAVWSPDGQHIVYSVQADLFTVGEDGLQPHRLFSAPGHVNYLRWSPDGKYLTFSVRSYVTSTVSLWQIGSDGTDPHALSFGWNAPTSHWGYGECCGDWSQDGRYFLFRSFRDGINSLWLLRPKRGWFDIKASKPVQLYSSPYNLNEPRFSADGRKILFVNYQRQPELARYDSARSTFMPYLGGIPAQLLSFSSNRQWVAYRNGMEGTLWRARTDGGEKVQLTFAPMDILHPTWSPDGKTIAFEGDGRLYVVPFEGGKIEPLLPAGTRDGEPSWSPDGKTLVFHRWLKDSASLGLLDMKTRQVQLMSDTDGLECPKWSPDGKYIAAGDKKNEKVVLFDLANQRWSALVEGVAHGWSIRWSSDSRYVYYQHDFSEDQPIFRVSIRDRKVEQITSAKQILRADLLSYIMTGLTPDGSPLVSLLHSNSDVHALELDLP